MPKNVTPSSFKTGRMLSTSFAAMPIIGNPLSALTATHPLSTPALSHVLIVEQPLPPFNLPLTTLSPLLIPIFFDLKPVTTLSVQSIPIISYHLHRSWNNNVSITSCAISVILAPTDLLPFLPLPLLLEHHSHDLSGLAREVFDSGLVRVIPSGGT